MKKLSIVLLLLVVEQVSCKASEEKPQNSPVLSTNLTRHITRHIDKELKVVCYESGDGAISCVNYTEQKRVK